MAPCVPQTLLLPMEIKYVRVLRQLRTYLDDVRRLRFQAERVGGVVIIRDRLRRAHRRPEPFN